MGLAQGLRPTDLQRFVAFYGSNDDDDNDRRPNLAQDMDDGKIQQNQKIDMAITNCTQKLLRNDRSKRPFSAGLPVFFKSNDR